MTASQQAALIDLAIALARTLQKRACELQTPHEARQQAELDRMLQTPADKVTLVQLTDQAFRSHAATRTADETANKPDPLMLRELLEELRVPVERALMIGDTEYDAAMARAIGMPMLGVTCGVHAPHRILAAGAMALVESVADLPRWLEG